MFNRWDPLIRTTCLVTRRVNTAAGDDDDDEDVLGSLRVVDSVVDGIAVVTSLFFLEIEILLH